jgi:hypothetical protein
MAQPGTNLMAFNSLYFSSLVSSPHSQLFFEIVHLVGITSPLAKRKRLPLVFAKLAAPHFFIEPFDVGGNHGRLTPFAFFIFFFLDHFQVCPGIHFIHVCQEHEPHVLIPDIKSHALRALRETGLEHPALLHQPPVESPALNAGQNEFNIFFFLPVLDFVQESPAPDLLRIRQITALSGFGERIAGKIGHLSPFP